MSSYWRLVRFVQQTKALPRFGRINRAITHFSHQSFSTATNEIVKVNVLEKLKSQRTVDDVDATGSLNVYAYMVKMGMSEDVDYLRLLFFRLATMRFLPESVAVFHRISVKARTTKVWNLMIKCYFDHSYFSKGVDIYKQMRAAGIKPDTYTMSHMLSGFKNCPDFKLKDCMQFFYEITSHHNITLNAVHYNILVDLVCRKDSPEAGFEYATKVPLQDAVTWRTVIKRSEEANDCLTGERAIKALQGLGRLTKEDYATIIHFYRRFDKDAEESHFLKLAERERIHFRAGVSTISTG